VIVDDDNGITELLKRTKIIAVVGLSANSSRPSFYTAKYVQAHGYKIVPVNPALTEVLGEKCYARLADIPHAIDMVNCFRRSEEIDGLADEAIAIGAKSLWLQLGVINDAAIKKASAAGLITVMDRCVKIEHARLGILNM